jgi:hypothetical protein
MARGLLAKYELPSVASFVLRTAPSLNILKSACLQSIAGMREIQEE